MNRVATTLTVEPLLDWRVVVAPSRWDAALQGEALDMWIERGRVPMRAARRIAARLGTSVSEVWFR